MQDTTTIQITTDTRDDLDARKQSDESYNAVVRRMLDGAGHLWTEDEIRDIAQSEVKRAVEDMGRRR